MTSDKGLILLIEDEPQMRRFLRVTLQSHGYDLLESSTGQDGLAQAATRNPDVILREEDPRVRAARRAEEIRNHLGTMDEGTDEFYIDPRDIPPGWSYEWKRKVVMGKEDPAYQVHLARMGWEPVPASRHPSYMPEGTSVATIERKGMILMERPSELSEEARAIEQRRARNQVKQKESQLNSAPEGTMQRTRSDGTALTSIKKSYEAIPVPND